jgi:hypothetical protein
MNLAATGDLALGFLAGAALGVLHLLWLWRAAARLGARTGAAGLLAGAALRLAVIVAGFAAVAWLATQPGLALIAALGGFMAARTLGLWRSRRVGR